jgi:putative copper export protein
MSNNIEILLMVIAVNVFVLGIAFVALYRLNKAVDQFDR